MTKRKPPGVSFGTWVDQQIQEAIDRGEFDRLPGAGKPIGDLDKPYEELWVTRKLHKEGLSTEDALPTSLKLRKEVERLPETVRSLPTESAVRRAVEELNERIRAWVLLPTGPQVPLAPVDVERIVGGWRAARRSVRPAPQPELDRTPKKPRWWHRLRRSR